MDKFKSFFLSVSVFFLVVCAGILLFSACTKSPGDTTEQPTTVYYYQQTSGDTLDDSVWIALLSDNTWENSEGDSGTYARNDATIEFFIDGESVFSGSIIDKVLSVNDIIYCESREDENTGDDPNGNDTPLATGALITSAGAYATISGNTVSFDVTNAASSVDLSQIISVSTGASWKLYADSAKTNQLTDKTSALSNGLNTLYVLVTAENGTSNTYTLKIFRNYAITITYKNGTEIFTTQQQLTHTLINVSPSIFQTGYTFNGWKNGSADSVGWYIEGDVTFNASWTANTYTITLNAGGGTISSTTLQVTYGQAYTLPVPEKNNYTFSGWYRTQAEGGTKIAGADGTPTFNWMITQSVTLDSHWVPVVYNYTTQKNISDAGTVSASGSAGYNTLVSISAATNPGYSFLGWYDSQDNVVTSNASFSFNITNSVSYTAKWQYNSYAVTMNVNGGDGLPAGNTLSVTYHSPYTLSVPTRTNYTFVGWYNTLDCSGERLTDGSGVSESVWNTADVATVYAGWVETSKAISTLNDLMYMSLSGEYYLVCDLDASSVANWKPLGWNQANGFTGYFDGCGYTVSGLTVSAATSIVSSSGGYGLFSYVSGSATIKNINASITFNYGNSCLGGITGSNYGGTITNCKAEVLMQTSYPGDNNYVGGIVGWNNSGNINGCTAEGTIIGNTYAGGIAGYAPGGTILNCSAKNVTVTSSGYAGGVAGYAKGGSISNCSTSDSSVSGVTQVGGIAGYIGSGYSVSDCSVSSSTVSLNNTLASDAYIGGIAGYLDGGSAVNCSSDSDISVSNSSGETYAGGIAGYLPHASECISEGNLTADGCVTIKAGGIAGFSAGNVSDCSSSLNLVGENLTGSAIFGGLLGLAGTSVKKSFSCGLVSIEVAPAEANVEIFAGGLIGFNLDTDISLCFSTGNAISRIVSEIVSSAYAGGFIAYNAGPITNCYSCGNASAYAYSYAYAGGFVGFNFNGDVSTCYATGNVYCQSSYKVYSGGFIGTDGSPSTIQNCFATGNVTGVGVQVEGISLLIYIGPFSSFCYATMNNCYYCSEQIVSGENATNTSYVTETVKINLQSGNFLAATVDFGEFISEEDLEINTDNVWIFEASAFPTLYWQP